MKPYLNNTIKKCPVVLFVLAAMLFACAKPIPELASPESTIEEFIARARPILRGDFSQQVIWECFTKADEKWFGDHYKEFFDKTSASKGEQHGIYYTYSPIEKAALGLSWVLEQWLPDDVDYDIRVRKEEEKTAWVDIFYPGTGRTAGRWGLDFSENRDDDGVPDELVFKLVKKGPNWKIDGFFGYRTPWNPPTAPEPARPRSSYYDEY